MPQTNMWNELSPEDWRSFARDWIAELNGTPSREGEDVGQKVVLMNFTASPEQQWLFIQAAVDATTSEDDLAAIGAGPLEHLLANHGDEYISRIEQHASASRSFALAVAGMWRNTMSDDVWSRVETIQGKAQEQA